MSYAILRLVKDVLLSLVAVVITVIFSISNQDPDLFNIVFTGLLFAGVPFGWRFLSKFISSWSVAGFLFKLIVATIIGWIALPITLIKDVVVLIISICCKSDDGCEEVA